MSLNSGLQPKAAPEKPFVGAINGEAFIVEENGVGLKIRTTRLKTSRPVFKAFGLTSDNRNLLYIPLKNGAPSGELILENLKTGLSRKVTSKLVLSASISPVDDNYIAFTFAGGEKFGLALAELNSGRTDILVAENVFTETVEWDETGRGIHYFRTSVQEPELKQDGISFYMAASPETGKLELTGQYLSLDSRLSSTALLSPEIPAGFPVLENADSSSLAENKADSSGYGFRTVSKDGRYEVLGKNLLGSGDLTARENSSGRTVLLGRGQLLKVLDAGVVFKEFAPEGTKLTFADWNGNLTNLGMTVVNYNLPVKTSVMVQGGAAYPSPGNCSISAHSQTMEYAYDFRSSNVSEHVMASADGLVVFTTSSVTCNLIDTTSCSDYSPTGCPGTFLGNVVVIQHADGSYTKYAHMETNSPQAVVGTTVDQGLYIGRQGHTGSTSGTFNGCGDHLHFQLQSTPDIFGQSIAVDFADVAVEPLSCGTTYTSASNEISHSISPASQNFGISGGNGTVNVTSTGGTWSAVSNDSWITMTYAGSGSGNDVVNFSVADNSASGDRTGTIFIGGHVFTVFQTGGGVTNQPPTVNAGTDQTVTLPASAVLNGTASDDGLPNPPATLTTAWSKVSGPGTVTFGNANSLNTTADFPMAGIYVLRLTASDGTLISTDDITVVANVTNAGGALSGNVATGPASINLTTEGTEDWVHWGLTSGSSFNHKSGVTPKISNFTTIGSITPLRIFDNLLPFKYSWSDGTPTTSATNTNTGLFVYDVGNGFQLTVPADTTPRTLKLYLTVYGSTGKLEATLSDGSASPHIGSITSTGDINRVYTLDYQAASAGQTLTINWIVDSNGSIGIQAASLATTQQTNQPPTVNAGADQSITLPASANLTGTASDDGLPNPPATLTTTWSQVSGPGTVTFGNANALSTTAGFSTAGTYTLRLTADDGSLTTTDDAIITVNSSGGSSGTLNFNGALAPGNVNLTSEGTSDWAHWGLGGSSGFNHKSGITQQISNYTKIGSGAIGSFNDNSVLYNWSDGTPTASATNNTSAIFIKGANRGFELNIPADTTQRTLKVYVGLYAAQGQFEASLSDSSATPVVDTSVTNQTGTTNQVYTITYSAGSSGQNLKVKWTAIATFNSWGNVTLQGASLAGPSGPPVNQPPTVNAGADQSITLPASANLTGTASDDGLPNPPATLTTTWSQGQRSRNGYFRQRQLAEHDRRFQHGGSLHSSPDRQRQRLKFDR
ncbi:MAG: peptidoglycan DD-metalloendopeptidase family protein [Pyrinomonadaceae bacterium]